MSQQLRALRGIAILIVLLNHSIEMAFVYSSKLGYNPPNAFAKNFLGTLQMIGIFAVPLFLFISGEFFAYALKGRDWKQSYAIIRNGTLHLLVPYLIWSLVFYALVFVLQGEGYTFPQYIKNILVGYPNNYLPIQIFFYFSAPIFFKMIKSHPVVVLILTLAFQMVLLNIQYPGALGFSFPEWVGIFRIPVLNTTLARWFIFFPLGLAYSLHLKKVSPFIRSIKIWLALITVGLFIPTILDDLGVISFPLALQCLCPMVGVLLVPFIRRDAIPSVRFFENIGKYAYGLYLTNLIMFTCAIFAFHVFIPGLESSYFIFIPILFICALFIPLMFMKMAQFRAEFKFYHYIFG